MNNLVHIMSCNRLVQINISKNLNCMHYIYICTAFYKMDTGKIYHLLKRSKLVC